MSWEELLLSSHGHHYIETLHGWGPAELECILSNLPAGLLTFKPGNADDSGKTQVCIMIRVVLIPSLILALTWCLVRKGDATTTVFFYSCHWLLSHFCDENFNARRSLVWSIEKSRKHSEIGFMRNQLTIQAFIRKIP